ncbi:MAG: hypothetical protein IJ644_10000 [Oscillospiraceae bacterium]|nr:hypothetical protein [Oscillospiraceae bacterium]
MKKTGKLIIHNNGYLDQNEATTVRVVLDDKMLAELNALSKQTGISLQQLGRILIEYALDNVEVQK